MSWILDKLLGIRVVQQEGVPLPQRRTIDIIGGVAEDDAANNRTKITVGAGAIANVTGTLPISVSGAGTKNVAIALATSGGAGAMSAADKAKLDEYPPFEDMATQAYVDDAIAAIPAGLADVIGTAPIAVTGTTTKTVAITAADAGTSGSMSAAHYSAVAARLDAAPAHPASAGGLRLGNTEVVKARNAANSADVAAVGVTSADVVELGDDTAAAGVTSRAKTGGLWKWLVNNVEILRFSATNLLWGETIAGTIGAVGRTSDAAPNALTILGQAPYASATGSNRTPGSIIFDFPAPTNSGTTEGVLKVRYSAVDTFWFSKLASYQSELRCHTTQFVIRTNDVNNGIIDIYAAGVSVSGGTFELKDSGQSSRGKWAVGSSSITFTADASVTTYSFVQNKRSGNGANAGTTLKIRAQDGQNVAAGTNNNGGKLVLGSGGAGTGGSGGAGGDIELQVADVAVATVKGDGSGVLVDADVTAKRHRSTPFNLTDASTVDLDLSKTKCFQLDLTMNTTFTVSNMGSGGYEFIVRVRQMSPGSHTTAWPADFELATGQGDVDATTDYRTIWHFYVGDDAKVTCMSRNAAAVH